MALTLKQRQEAEREIVRAVLNVAIEQGWTLNRVDNGDDWEKVNTVDEAMEHAFACDEAHIDFTKDGKNAWVFIVLGNGGWDVVSDYTTNLDSVIEAPVVEATIRMWEERDVTEDFIPRSRQ